MADAPTVEQLSLWYRELKMVHKRLRDAYDATQAEVKRYKTTTSRVVDEYVCPITHQLPVDPVLAEDGMMYDRRSIAEWIEKNQITGPTGDTFVKSPMSNANMGTKLTEMRLVRNTIQELIDGNLVDDEMAAAVQKQRALKEAAEAGDPEAMYNMGVEAFDRALDLLKGEAKAEAYKSNDWFRRGAAAHDMKCMAMEGSHLYRGFEPWNTDFEKEDRTEQNGLQGYIKHGLVLIAQSANEVDLAAYCMALAYMRGDLGANFPHLSSIPSAHADQAKYWLDKALGTEIRHKIMSDHDRFEAETELERVEKLQKKFEEQKQYVGEYRGEGVGKGKRVYPNGSVYEGDFTDGVQHGQGKMVYTDGNIYEGEWDRGAAHGRGRLVYPEGGYYEGEFQNNEPQGQGKLVYSDGNVYEGAWERGMTHGHGRVEYSDGNVYEGEWVRNRTHGHGKIVYADGGYYEGSFEDDAAHGKGTMVYENGNVYEGGWQRGMANGHGKLRYTNGTIYEGNFENNEPQGRGSVLYPNGDAYEGEMNQGKRHGKGKMTYQDRVYEGEWKDDTVFGECLPRKRKNLFADDSSEDETHDKKRAADDSSDEDLDRKKKAAVR